MTEGAVAIIDALGFKGIWKKHDPEQVLAKLRQQKQNAQNDLELFHKTFPQADDFHILPRVQFLSDTIVVGVQLYPFVDLLSPGDKVVPEFAKLDEAYADIKRFIALKQCCSAIAVAVADGLALNPPLAYRGTVAFGEFAMDGEFLIGPAIDDAAAQCELPDGAFVFLAESALHLKARARSAGEHLKGLDPEKFTYLDDLLSEDSFNAKHKVPLKHVGSLDTFTLDPVRVIPTEHRGYAVQRLMATFGDDPKILEKKANTQMFLTSLGYSNF